MMKPNSESSNFPDIFEQMQSVDSGLYSRTIRVRGRNPKYMPVLDGVLYRIQQAIKENRTELDLSHLNLTELPDELFKLTALTSLDISANQLKTLPEQIAQFKNLTLLSAHDNPIENIGDEIKELSELRTLLLNGCQLSKFPKGIVGLPNLQTLDLTGNAIKWIPVGLKDMDKLEEIILTGNPILNLPSQFHETTSVRLSHYYEDIASSADIKGPMLLSIYFTPSEEKNKNTEGDQFGEFNPAMRELLKSSSFMSKSISNPDGEYLFNRLFQYLQQVKILFILTDQLNHLRSPGGEMQSISPEDFSELFSCLQERELETKLLILDFQNAQPYAEKLESPDFNIILSRNSGTETNKDTLPYLFKNLLEGHSFAFVLSEMWKSKSREYRLSYTIADDFDTIFHSNILGTAAKHDIDTKEFKDLVLLHMLVDIYPTKESSLVIAKEAGLNILNIAFSDKSVTNWFNILDVADKENKIRQLLDTVMNDYPPVSKLIAPLVSKPSPTLSIEQAIKRQNELIRAGYKIIADGRWGPKSDQTWNEYQLNKSVKK